MVESAASTRHISMKGGGYYSKATIGAKDVIDGGAPMIMEALSTMDIPDIATPFTMADSGCADGGTSVAMVGTVLKYAAERRTAPSKWSIPTCRETTSVGSSAIFSARPMSIPMSKI